MNAAMQACRTFTTEDGVTFHMLPFSTPLSDHVMTKMRDEFGKPTQTPNGIIQMLPEREGVYGLGAGTTLRLDLPASPPIWAAILKEFLSDRSYMADPVAGWWTLASVAPAELFTSWWAGYQGTRPIEILAPEPLRKPGPPDELEDENGDIVKNPTIGNGGES